MKENIRASEAMRIMFVIPEMNRGGAEKMVAYLANSFVTDQNCKVYLSVFDNSDSSYVLDDSITYIKLNCSSKELKYRIPVVNKIKKIIKDNSIHVVFGFSIGVSEILAFAKCGTDCKMIGSERSNPYSKKMSKMRRLLQSAIVSRLDGMVFTTEGCKNYYPKRITNKSIVIPNGFIQSVDNQKNQIELHLASRNIIAVGNLRKVKDYPTMLKAFAFFSDNHPEYILNIYGEGIEENSIVELIKRLGISSKVILHGSVEHLEKVYTNACFLVHSSVSESWCNAILEALSFGVPCIAADCDFGPREMIENGLNGYLFPVGNTQELAACMDNIVSSKESLRNMSTNAFNSARKFEFKNIAYQYYEFGANIH